MKCRTEVIAQYVGNAFHELGRLHLGECGTGDHLVLLSCVCLTAHTATPLTATTCYVSPHLSNSNLPVSDSVSVVGLIKAGGGRSDEDDNSGGGDTEKGKGKQIAAS
ncbi:hypothetical protein E2C01_032266 [Portunus trituberculatus]|uniref:Uncharacterized protein n=1 Tax=Portunus trituberculatus TaxID=210409 RepID=A0A5B7EX24_PORTR|nr:hypothetical protein [Portunus trituberculatus]